MELQFLDADYVDLPTNRTYSMDKAMALLDRANLQLQQEGLKTTIEYALVDGETQVFQSSLRLPEDDLNLLEEIHFSLDQADAPEETLETLRQMINDSFPKRMRQTYPKKKGQKKEKEGTKESLKKNNQKNENEEARAEEDTALKIEFLALDAGELPLHTLLPVKKGIELLGRLNHELVAIDDSTEVTFQLATEELNYFQSDLFLPKEDVDILQDIRQMLGKLEEGEAKEELLRLFSESLGISGTNEQKENENSVEEGINPLEEMTDDLEPVTEQKTVSEEPKGSFLPKKQKKKEIPATPKKALFSSKEKGTAPMSKKMTSPLPHEPQVVTSLFHEKKSVSVSQLVTGASVCLACLSCVLAFWVKSDVHQLERQSDKIETLQQIQGTKPSGQVTKTSEDLLDGQDKQSEKEEQVETFSQLFLQQFLTKSKADTDYKKRMAVYFGEEFQKDLKNPRVYEQAVHPWAIETNGAEWNVSLIASDKDGEHPKKATFKVKALDSDHFQVTSHVSMTDFPMTE